MKKKIGYVGIPLLALMLLGLYWHGRKDHHDGQAKHHDEVVLNSSSDAKAYFNEMLSRIDGIILAERSMLDEIDAADSMESFGKVLGASFDSMSDMQKLTDQGSIMAKDGLSNEELERYVGQLNKAMETFGRLQSDLNQKIASKMEKYGSEVYIQKIVREKSRQLNLGTAHEHAHGKSCPHDKPATP